MISEALIKQVEKLEKKNKKLKGRVDKLELIISWLTDGDNDNIEAQYDKSYKEQT